MNLRTLVLLLCSFVCRAAGRAWTDVSACFVPHRLCIRRTNPARNLFFKATEDEYLTIKRRTALARIPKQALIDVGQDTVQLPFQFNLLEGDEQSEKQVTIRLLTTTDLDTLVPMCVVEFGTKATLDDLWKKFPWQQPLSYSQYVSDWWDNFALPLFISFTFRLKIFLGNPKDHALLVATLRKNDASAPDTVGMVELSQQPDEATRNPSAYPVPLWWKELYCRQKNLPPPNGWVTNLLVGPEYRGQGYSKLLMSAAEGVARKWGKTAIHLHCDANSVSGRIPQRLYQSLGYEMVEDKNSPYAWMGSEFSKKIYMIQGVALLYFRKLLVEDKQEG